MDLIKRTFIHYKDRSFTNSEGERIEWHQILTENNAEGITGFEGDTTLSISKDMVDELGLKDPKVVNALRGKNVNLEGVMYDNNGKLKFSVKKIVLA